MFVPNNFVVIDKIQRRCVEDGKSDLISAREQTPGGVPVANVYLQIRSE